MSEQIVNKPTSVTSTRRERVAQLVLRGLTAREIVAALASGDNRIINGRTGKPWSLGTIGTDLIALKAEWNRRANAAFDEHRARQLAEVAELKRAAWSSRRYETVLRCLEREAKLLGLDAPARDTQVALNLDVGNLSDEQLQRIANGEDPLRVISIHAPATASASGAGAAPTPGDEGRLGGGTV